MRRWPLRILLLLILLVGGAIINVAVAWACIWGTIRLNDRYVNAATVPQFVRQWPPGWTDQDGLVREYHQFGFDCYEAIGHFSDEPPPPPSGNIADNQYVHVLRVGWPEMSLQRSFGAYRSTDGGRGWSGNVFIGRYALPAMPVPVGFTVNNGGWSGNVFIGRRAFPAMPVPVGFTVNTVFYAVILWLLFAGPFVLRRWRRIRRGLCTKCAYDLRGNPESSTCPECGAARQPSRRKPRFFNVGALRKSSANPWGASGGASVRA